MSTLSKLHPKHLRSAATPSLDQVKVAPEAVQARAFEFYQARARNGAAGNELSDWLQAERELKERARGELLLHGDQD